MSVIETDEGLKVVERIKVIEKVKRIEPKPKAPRKPIRIPPALITIAANVTAYMLGATLVIGTISLAILPVVYMQFYQELDRYSYVSDCLERYPEIKPVVTEALEDNKLTRNEWNKIKEATQLLFIIKNDKIV